MPDHPEGERQMIDVHFKWSKHSDWYWAPWQSHRWWNVEVGVWRFRAVISIRR